MPTPDEFVSGYLRAAERLQDDAVNAAISAWRALGQYRDEDVARFKRLVVPVVQAQQSRMAALTSAFHSQVGRERGDDVPMVLLDRAQVVEPRGVPSDVVYQRPAATIYAELAAGGSFEAAVAKSENRLRQIVSTDMQLVKTRQSQTSLSAGGFTFYRRTLTGTEDCALCVIASTQRYRVGNLMPIHPGCNCGVDKVESDWEPPQVLDPALLDDTHGKISRELGVSDSGARDLGEGKLVQYKDGIRQADYTDLIVTREHGEVGPSLVWRSDRFTGPTAIKAATRIESVSEAAELLRSSGISASNFDDLVSVEAARDVAETAAGLARKYPKAGLTSVGFERLGVSGNAVGGSVRISNANAARPGALERVARNGIETGYSTRHNPVEHLRYVMTHEFGHVIDNATARVVRDRLNTIKAAVRRELGVSASSAEWKSQITGYGATSPGELVAEAFADVELNGLEARLLSRRIHDALMDAYGNLP